MILCICLICFLALHIIEPQNMLGLNEAALHDPMVTQQESSDEDDNDDANHQDGQVSVYNSTDSALFMVMSPS